MHKNIFPLRENYSIYIELQDKINAFSMIILLDSDDRQIFASFRNRLSAVRIDES